MAEGGESNVLQATKFAGQQMNETLHGKVQVLSQSNKELRSGLHEIKSFVVKEVTDLKKSMAELKAMLANVPGRAPSQVDPSIDPTVQDSRRDDAIIGNSSAIYDTFMSANIGEATARPPVAKPAPLPTFDGNPAEAASWLRLYEQAASHNFWRDPDMVRGVGRALLGSANNWFLFRFLPQIPPGGEIRWNDFKLAFQQQYFRESDRLRLFDILRNRYQRPNERPSNYFHIMIGLCIDYNPSMSEEEIVNHTIRGLMPEYKANFGTMKEKSLNALEAILKNLEDHESPRRIQRESDVKANRSRVLKKSEEKDSGNAPVRQRRDPVDVVCYNCLSKGHYMSNCALPKDIAKIRENIRKLKDQRKGQSNDIPVQNIQEEMSQGSANEESSQPGWGILSISAIECTEDGMPFMPIIQCVMAKKYVPALIDTGARVSVISNRLRMKLNLEMEPWTKGRLKMANKTSDTPSGLVTTVLTMSKCVVAVNLVVIKESVHDLILGSDFCRKHKVDILFSKQQIVLREPGSNTADLWNVYELRSLDWAGIELDYPDVFAESRADVGLIKDAIHDINTENHPPISMKPRRLSTWERGLVDVLLEDMLQARIIQPSMSPWSSPIVLISKKDGETRFCVDYRELNKITVDDPYPIPRVEDALDLLEGCVKFSKLDIASMFWHIKLTDRARLRSAFVVPQGHYEFLRMPFGLKNAPATAVRTMSLILAGYNFTICYVYFDDILVFGKTTKEHDIRLRLILERLRDYNIKLRRHKCEFHLDAIDYLGYHIGKHGITPSETNIETVLKFPEPKSSADVRRFNGLCSYFRRFIPNYAKVAYPLTILLRKNTRFEWKEKQRNAFETLKKIVTSKPVLRCFQSNGAVELHTDACDYGIGAVLLQDSENGIFKPVCYVSRSLSPAETAYGVTEKECLSIVWCTMRLRHYLYGRFFTVVTDHCGLCWFMTSKSTNTRLLRWALKLQDFNFVVRYKSGKLHGAADCISRYPSEAPVEEDTWYENPLAIYAIEIEDSFKKEQRSDPFCTKLRDKLLSKDLSKRAANRLKKRFTVSDGIVYMIRESSLIPILPKCKVEKVLKESHSSPTGGHFGVKKTYEKLKTRVYWPKMSRDIADYIRSCPDCQVKKPYQSVKLGLMQPIQVPEDVFTDVSLDILELPVSDSNYRYLVVINDRLSKFAEAVPVEKQTSDQLITAFYEGWILKFGVPIYLITDRGTNLLSVEFQEFLEALNIKHKPTSAYHPQTDGQTERFNEYLGVTLSMYAKENCSEWEKYLRDVLFAYNTTPHVTTKQSPFMMVYGREPRLPLDSVIGTQPIYTRIHDRLEVLKDVKDQAKQNITDAQSNAKSYYDRFRNESGFKVDDLVLVKVPRLVKGRNKKFLSRFKGPYRIIKQLSPVTYEVVNIKGPVKHTSVHVSRLKPYHDPRSNDTSEVENHYGSDEEFEDWLISGLVIGV